MLIKQMGENNYIVQNSEHCYYSIKALNKPSYCVNFACHMDLTLTAALLGS